MTLDFTILTAAQRRLVRSLYVLQADTEADATHRALIRTGWIEPSTHTLTPAARQAYEYWLAWGDLAELPSGTIWIGNYKVKKSYLQKLKRAQAEARQAIERAGY